MSTLTVKIVPVAASAAGPSGLRVTVEAAGEDSSAAEQELGLFLQDIVNEAAMYWGGRKGAILIHEPRTGGN